MTLPVLSMHDALEMFVHFEHDVRAYLSMTFVHFKHEVSAF